MQRVTQKMVVDNFQANLNDIFSRLAKVHDQLSSGQRIRRPSDDPPGTNQALSLRSSIQLNEQLVRTIDLSKNWLQSSESALGTLSDLLARAKELGVQGANDTYSATDRQNMAREADQLVGAALAAANTTLVGAYVFAGTKTTTQPFASQAAPGTTVVYSGDTQQMPREIGPNLHLSINTTGDQLVSVIQALVGLRDQLQSGTASTVANELLSVDNAIDQVDGLRADIGAKINRFDFTEERLRDVQLQLSGLLSLSQDVDITEAASKFQLEQTVYQTALKAGANAIQPSLLDFLK